MQGFLSTESYIPTIHSYMPICVRIVTSRPCRLPPYQLLTIERVTIDRP